MRFRSSSWLLLVLVLCPCLMLAPIFTGRCLLPANLLFDIDPWRTIGGHAQVPWNVLQFDGITQFYPWRLYAAQTWRAGYVPLWNPHQFCGTPFLSNGQSAVLYPLNVLFLLMPVKFAFGVSALIHLILTGMFLKFFARRALGISTCAATLAGVIWQLSTWQISWLALPTFLCTSAWLPLALLLIDRFTARPDMKRASIVGIVLAMMLVAGHLQIAVYCILLTGAFGIFRVIQQRPPIASVALYGAVAVAVAAFLSAPQILPTLELSHVGHRAGGIVDWTGYGRYARLALSPVQLSVLVAPGLFGHPGDGTYWGFTNYAENAGYTSVTAFVLACIAVARRRIPPELWFFLMAALVSLLIALGTPLGALLYFGIPGFAQTGSPARILVIWTLCLAVLAGYGLDYVLKKDAVVSGMLLSAAAALALIVTTWAGVRQIDPALESNIVRAANDLRLLAGLLMAAACIIGLYLRGTASRPVTSALLVLLVAGDLLFINYGYNPAVQAADVYPATPLTTWLQHNASSRRIMPVNHAWSTVAAPPTAVLPPNAATVYGLFDIQGYDSLQTAQFKAFANRLDDNHDSSPEENGNMLFTYGVDSPLAITAGAGDVVTTGPVAGMGTPAFTDGQSYVYALLAGSDIVSSSYLPTRVEIDLPAAGGTLPSVQYMPGWTATFNGKPVSVIEQTPPFLTLSPVAAGPGHIELRYQPVSYRFGLYLALTAFAFITALAIGSRRP